MSLRITMFAAVALVASLFIGWGVAQSPTSKEDSPLKYKMTTEIPSGIASPSEVETRLGKLKFFDGVPDQASAEKIYDNLDFQRAVQAYLLALPVVNQIGNRDNILTMGPANTTVPIWEDLVDSRTVELTANNNTPYTWFWLDLRKGPVVVEAPPKVLGLVNDIWYHWNGDIGITGPDKGAGGKYLLLPPDYKGAVPEGYFVIRPGSLSVWAAWRSFVVDGDPKPGVEAVKRSTKIYPLVQAGSPPELKFVNMSGKSFNMVAPADYRFWELLNKVVQDEPTDAVDATTLGLWASVGIRKGQPFAPDPRMKKILTEAAAVGDATGRALGYRTREKSAFFFDDRQWKRPFIGGYKFEWQPGVPNLDGAAMYFFMATGVTPAMDTQIVGEGSTYPWTAVDAKNQPLDGGKNYKLRLPPNVPVKTFWSVIVYDTQTRSMLQTDQQFPSVSSQNKNLQVNENGSVDVFFGPRAPQGKESNWVQTIPGRSWCTILRLYGPLEPWFNKSWKPGDIEVVEAADRAENPAFKGMELYSWKPDGEDWHFSILVGTNRFKTDEEIKKPEQTVVGIEELKKRLESFAEGEIVFWRNLAREAVPEEMAKELKKFCEGIKVKLRQGEPLPNGYAVFFASASEASVVKPATKGGECIAGPCVTELGNSGNYIFGRIEPKKGLPPHPDHAPGFFVIDSATDKVTTGLDREKWLADLKAVGIDSPQLQPPEHKWPKTY